ADADIAAHVLGGGRASRLYQKLVYEKQIAQDVNVYQYSLLLGSQFGIEVTARPGHTPEEIEQAVNTELDALRTQPVEQREIDQAWRAQMPKAGPAKGPQIAVPETVQLANGLTIILSTRRTLPIVAANLVVRSGSDANPPEMPGLANFTVSMLDQGTAARSAVQIANEIAQLGATVNTNSSMDASTIAARSLKKNFA